MEHKGLRPQNSLKMFTFTKFYAKVLHRRHVSYAAHLIMLNGKLCEKISHKFAPNSLLPPLVPVRRCNGTTAGLDYKEVAWIVLCKVLHWKWACVRIIRIWTVWMIIVPNLRWRTFRYWAIRVTGMWDMGSSPSGQRHNSSADFNLKSITTTQLHFKQASSWPQETPQRKPQAK